MMFLGRGGSARQPPSTILPLPDEARKPSAPRPCAPSSALCSPLYENPHSFRLNWKCASTGPNNPKTVFRFLPFPPFAVVFPSPPPSPAHDLPVPSPPPPPPSRLRLIVNDVFSFLSPCPPDRAAPPSKHSLPLPPHARLHNQKQVLLLPFPPFARHSPFSTFDPQLNAY